MSTTNGKRAVAGIVAAFAAAFAVLLFTVSPAKADTLADCQAKLLNGTLDLNGYLACVASANASSSSSTGNANTGNSNITPITTTTSGTLPVTGSDTGRLVGIGAALIVLGGAALYGATRRREAVDIDDES